MNYNPSDYENINNKDFVKFDEEQALFELERIIQQAIANKDINQLANNLHNWVDTYKGKPFKRCKDRVDFLLSEAFLSSIRTYILSLKRQSELFSSKKARKEYNYLRDLIENRNLDIKELKKEIKKWRTKNPIEKFSAFYQKRINLVLRDSNIEAHNFDHDIAFDEFKDIFKHKYTMQELKREIALWDKKYLSNGCSIDDMKKYRTELLRFREERYLESIARVEEKEVTVKTSDKPTSESTVKATTEATSLPPSNENTTSDAIQESQDVSEENQEAKPISVSQFSKEAYLELQKIISTNPRNYTELFNWAYKYRLYISKFDDYTIGLIVSSMAPYYIIPTGSSCKLPDINSENNKLSFDEYVRIDEIRKDAFVYFLHTLLNRKYFSGNELSTFSEVYSDSNTSRVIEDLTDSVNSSIVAQEIFESPTPIEVKKPSHTEPEDASVVEEISLIDESLDSETLINNTLSTCEFELSNSQETTTPTYDDNTSPNYEDSSEEHSLEGKEVIIISPVFYEMLDQVHSKSIQSENHKSFDEEIQQITIISSIIPLKEKETQEKTLLDSFEQGENEDFLVSDYLKTL